MLVTVCTLAMANSAVLYVGDQAVHRGKIGHAADKSRVETRTLTVATSTAAQSTVVPRPTAAATV